MPSTDCYEVKVVATMTHELKCLFEKLGESLFTIERTCPPAEVKGGKVTWYEEEPQILDITFDKCDPCKVTFIVYAELPCVKIIDGDLKDEDNDQNLNSFRVVEQEFRIRTTAHMGDYHELLTFVVYPLPECVSSRNFDTECYCYEICRVPCIRNNIMTTTKHQQQHDHHDVSEPESFRIVFPLSQEIACLIPEFGLSGFYLKNLVATSLKTKVRLCPIGGRSAIAVGLLSYDSEKCEACLEYCSTDDEENLDLASGYECLLDVSPGQYFPPSLETMAASRRFVVKGLSKCTEKTLLDFGICFKPSLSDQDHKTPVMNYTITAEVCGDLCSEFFVKECPELEKKKKKKAKKAKKKNNEQ